ncbi:MAG TPA: hypothetical protein VG738_12185 [Chitinophagaceae bacterium]|nr:hypothetical protein [Chitinophagaceae bacterium]
MNFKSQAREMCSGFMKSDFKVLVKYIYPAIVKMMGGPEKMEAV